MSTEKPRCGHPTKRGGLCRNYPMGGSDHCYRHAGLPLTEEQRKASRTARLAHGYFVSGFLDDEERELFQAVLEGELDPSEIKRHIIAALMVRIGRMTKWEAEGQPVSGFTNEAYGELRKAVESVTPEELRVKHSWDDAEVAEQVRRVLAADPELLIRLLPPEAQGKVREALQELGP